MLEIDGYYYNVPTDAFCALRRASRVMFYHWYYNAQTFHLQNVGNAIAEWDLISAAVYPQNIANAGQIPECTFALLC